MNQDQVKEKLLQLRPEVKDFTVIFSGKQSKKVNGLYHPENCEIIIHNKNFEDDNSLMYTAIHEFAHHIDTNHSQKCHTTKFRALVHELLDEAETKGIYIDVVAKVPELQAKAERIRIEYIQKQAELLKAMGNELMESEKLCRKHGARFEDFIERSLKITTQSATSAMKIKAMDLPIEIGVDNMKVVSAIKNDQTRMEATGSLMAGDTLDQVKQQVKAKASEYQDTDVLLMREKKRIQAAMDKLVDRLEQIDMILEEHGDQVPHFLYDQGVIK